MNKTSWTRVRMIAMAIGCFGGSACGGGTDKATQRDASEDPSEAEQDASAEVSAAEADGSDAGSGEAADAQVDSRVADAEAGTLDYSLELLDPDMRAVIDKLIALGPKPIETLAPEEARIQPTVFDAAKAVQQAKGLAVQPEAVGKIEYRSVPGPAASLVGTIVYSPAAAGPHPVIVYFHGGGWVLATVETYEASARALTNAVPAVLVSVEYRKAPENKFPSAHDDAYAVYQWVVQNAAALGGDPARVAVAGESAGGNLAASVALRARDEMFQKPTHALLVYPVASTDLDTPSYREHANAKPLNKAMIPWFTGHYFRTSADGADPRISLVSANLNDLGPFTILNAEVDPLRSDGERLSEKLKAAGVPVVQKTYPGVTHEFFGMTAVVSTAKEAVTFAAERLRESFMP